MEQIIRVGVVSSINYETGCIRVTYPDKDNAVSGELPCFSHCYEMPEVGEKVVVFYLSNGKSEGFAIGKYFNPSNMPIEFGKGIIHKPLGETGCLKYDEASDTLTIKAGNIILEGDACEINIKNIQVNADSSSITTTGSQSYSGKQITLTGTHESSTID